MTAVANITAYAVHIDGGLLDDRDISAWTTDPHRAVTMLQKAEKFFAGDEPLLTIVRAEFTPDEWETTKRNGWTAPPKRAVPA